MSRFIILTLCWIACTHNTGAVNVMKSLDEIPGFYEVRMRNKFLSLNDIPGYSKDVDGDDVYVNVSQGQLRGKRRQGDPAAGLYKQCHIIN